MATTKIRLPERITRMAGKPFRLTKYDDNDAPIVISRLDKDGRPVGVDVDVDLSTDLKAVLEHFILRGFPREKYSRTDALHCNAVFKALRESQDSVLELFNDDYEWLKKRLEDDDIGVRMFMYDLPVLVDAMTNIDKAEKPKEGKSAS